MLLGFASVPRHKYAVNHSHAIPRTKMPYSNQIAIVLIFTIPFNLRGLGDSQGPFFYIQYNQALLIHEHRSGLDYLVKTSISDDLKTNSSVVCSSGYVTSWRNARKN